MPGKPNGHHDQTNVEDIPQNGDDRVFDHILVYGKQPATQGREEILPTEVLINNLILFNGNGKDEGNP